MEQAGPPQGDRRAHPARGGRPRGARQGGHDLGDRRAPVEHRCARVHPGRLGEARAHVPGGRVHSRGGHRLLEVVAGAHGLVARGAIATARGGGGFPETGALPAQGRRSSSFLCRVLARVIGMVGSRCRRPRLGPCSAGRFSSDARSTLGRRVPQRSRCFGAAGAPRFRRSGAVRAHGGSLGRRSGAAQAALARRSCATRAPFDGAHQLEVRQFRS